MFGRGQLFRDPAVPLTPAQESSARRAARRAARWRDEYPREYRGGGQINEGGLRTGVDTSGVAGGL